MSSPLYLSSFLPSNHSLSLSLSRNFLFAFGRHRFVSIDFPAIQLKTYSCEFCDLLCSPLLLSSRFKSAQRQTHRILCADGIVHTYARSTHISSFQCFAEFASRRVSRTEEEEVNPSHSISFLSFISLPRLIPTFTSTPINRTSSQRG